MAQDKIVLNFQNCLLRESDISILKGPKWFNDSLISFYFEFLGTVQFKGNNSLLFVSPEVTQCIKGFAMSEISVFLDPLHALKKDFIFFALNDNDKADRCGGSHWSLLVLSKPEETCYHFDSHSGLNLRQAKNLSNRLMCYFEISMNVVEYTTLQQSNGYDCGAHVLCNTEFIAMHVTRFHRIAGCGMVDNMEVLNKRLELLELIYSLTN